MKFLVAFTCLLAVVTAKPGFLGHTHLGYAGYAGHAVAPSFAYSSVTAHAAPVVAHAAPASVAHHVAVAPVAHAAVAAAPVAAAVHTHSAIAHHAALPAVAHHAAFPAVAHHAALPAVAHHAAVVPAVAHHAVAHHAVAAPVAYAAPVAPVIEKTQYHAQDFLGQASYGHNEAFQQHHAVQDAAGNKVGSYSWVAPNGQVIAGKYVADALGYRVHSNAVPVGPAPVADTPEVIAARSAHIAAHIAVKSHHHLVRRGIVAAAPAVAYTAPAVAYAAPAVAYTAAVASPLHYTAHYNRALVAPVVHAKAHLHYGYY